MAEIIYTVEEQIGVLSQNGKYSVEVNVINWNNKGAKVDIRRWSEEEDGKRAGKGTTLTHDEAQKLVELLTDYLKGAK